MACLDPLRRAIARSPTENQTARPECAQVNDSFPGRTHTKWRQQLFWSYSCYWLYHGAGYTLIYFSKSGIFVAVRVIRRAGYRPENTLVLF